MFVAGCDSRNDDVVQAPAIGATPAALLDVQVQTAQTTAALAFGLTREEVEDADVLAAATPILAMWRPLS